jgi:hypothetical protein
VFASDEALADADVNADMAKAEDADHHPAELLLLATGMNTAGITTAQITEATAAEDLNIFPTNGPGEAECRLAMELFAVGYGTTTPSDKNKRFAFLKALHDNSGDTQVPDQVVAGGFPALASWLEETERGRTESTHHPLFTITAQLRSRRRAKEITDASSEGAFHKIILDTIERWCPTLQRAAHQDLDGASLYDLLNKTFLVLLATHVDLASTIEIAPSVEDLDMTASGKNCRGIRMFWRSFQEIRADIPAAFAAAAEIDVAETEDGSSGGGADLKVLMTGMAKTLKTALVTSSEEQNTRAILAVRTGWLRIHLFMHPPPPPYHTFSPSVETEKTIISVYS